MSTPLITLITVVYNGERHLERTITSVLNQKYEPLEYIVIDGGSRDGTLDIIRKYESRISYWISEPDKGIFDAFNKGLKQAKGELIGFINSDDWLENNALEAINNSYKKGTIVYGNVCFWKNGKQLNTSKSDHTRLRKGMTMAHPAVFVPKEIYDRYGNFKTNLKIASDYELLVRFFVNRVEFVKINDVIVNMNLGGISHSRWVLAIVEDLKVKNTYFSNTLLNYYYFFKQFFYLFFERTLRKFD
ncbi:MAG: glycosyltransferase family 2 protein [Bacteroidota bacterium]|nr:glycosyltransferase family 2 protein [Bacteroidota bacterium]